MRWNDKVGLSAILAVLQRAESGVPGKRGWRILDRYPKHKRAHVRPLMVERSGVLGRYRGTRRFLQVLDGFVLVILNLGLVLDHLTVQFVHQ